MAGIPLYMAKRLQKRRRRGRRRGLYPPLVWACGLLAAALLALAWQWAGGWTGLHPREQGEVDRWTIALYDPEADALRRLPLEQYLIGVVAAEMPASFHQQALRAQAVAARTRVVAGLLALGGGGCSAHAGADICGDSTHCQAWAGEAELRERWGGEFRAYIGKITEAVRDTGGQVMTYGGQLIQVLYHAVSGGATEDVENVFAQALPYLRGVDSPGEEGATRYESVQRFPYAQATEALNTAFPEAGLSPSQLSGGLEVLGRFSSGRVERVRVGGVEVAGTAFRRALGLYSANFTLAFEDGELVIGQRGYGHGVGMSQVGADAMARAGHGYAGILRHYYEGVALERW